VSEVFGVNKEFPSLPSLEGLFGGGKAIRQMRWIGWRSTIWRAQLERVAMVSR